MVRIIHNSDFFDRNVDFYSNVQPSYYDYIFINFIRKFKKDNSSLVDIGGGSGTFAHLLLDNCPDINVIVIDPSKALLEKIKDNRINIIIGNLPNNILLHSKFDFIHVKEVFHHIVGSSINESKNLLKKSLLTLRTLLKEDGFLLIHELFYESFLIPSLARTLIFNLLSFQNTLHVKIPFKEFLLGLQVIFYSRLEFTSILEECGYRIITLREYYWNHNFRTRLLFLKSWGRMLIIANKV